MPLVSFVLAAYKATYLREAIDSILAQTYTDFELAIVNDASPENIREIVDSYTDKRIKYYENATNVGGKDLVGQWNKNCLPKAQGEWMILASDDDVYCPTYLEQMLLLTEKYPHCDLFHCRVMKIDKDGKCIGVNTPSAEYEANLDFISQRLCNYRLQTVQEFMFRKKTMLDTGGFENFPLAFFTDDATWAKLSKNGVACCMDPLFKFRFSGINLSSNRETSQRMLLKLQACFLFTQWMRQYLEQSVCRDEKDESWKRDIYEGLKRKETEWINWTTRRVNVLDFIKILMIRKYRKSVSFGRWFVLLYKNIYERYFYKGKYY
jgi:glycosyltransferase involved in cell wall biosynthesis